MVPSELNSKLYQYLRAEMLTQFASKMQKIIIHFHCTYNRAISSITTSMVNFDIYDATDEQMMFSVERNLT
jgi:hypothetical protein